MEPMRTPFQFSIRELLLATTAIAALLALAQKYWIESRPIQGTELTSQYFIPAEVAGIAKALGVSHHFSISGGGNGSSNDVRRVRSGSYSFAFPPKYHDHVVYQLRQAVVDKVIAGGCRIHGRSSGGHWELNYSKGSMEGIVELNAVSEQGQTDRLHIMYSATEFRK